MKGIVYAAALFGSLAAIPAHAADTGAALSEESAASLGPDAYVWRDTGTAGPITIRVDVAAQRLYVYRGEALVAASSVSTGREGKETPGGVYTILQKNKDHRSNLYNSAPMPFMQRLTWDGIAIHAGRNPGFPDSHGCIRVPTAFAGKLFAITGVGTTVEVINSPVEGDTLVPSDVIARTDEETARAQMGQFASINR